MSQTRGSPCAGCERLPSPLVAPLTLYVEPPVGHVLGAVRRIATDLGLACAEPAPGILAVTAVDGPALASLVSALEAALTSPELAGTPALAVPAGDEPSIAHLLRAHPLDRIVAQIGAVWLAELLEADALVTHLQPIVESRDPDRVFGHECLTRGLRPDGTLVPPQTLFRAAHHAGLLYYLDRAARVRAIQTAAAAGVAGAVFVNFQPSAVYNPVFCLRSTVRAAEESGLAPSRIVLEVVETEEVRDTPHLVAILAVYREAGFRVALDDLGSGYGSLSLLHGLRPDFVKLDMGLVRGVDRDPVKATIAAKLLETAVELGVPSIAEGVETAAEWAWLRDHGAVYQQGFYFARPAAPTPRP